MATRTHRLAVIELEIEKFQEYKANPREHPEKQITMLEKSIRKFGFNSPLLVSPNYELIAGHGRLEAARRCGMTHLPAIVLAHLTEAERRAFRIADNAISLKAKWSLERLRTEVQFLMDDSFTFEVDELGFETGEFDFLAMGEKKDAAEPETVIAPRRDQPSVSRLGDIWTCAGHRILCGDALVRRCYEDLMGDELAAAVVTDMPYNRRVNGEIGGRGKVRHPEFANASGEMSRAEFSDFMLKVFKHQVAFSRDGALCLNFIDWRSVADMISVGERVFSGGLINLCVWAKQSPGMGSLWRSQHELVCAFKSGNAPHTNNVMLGKWGRNRSSLWSYPSPVAFGPERDKLELHPTSKNVDLLSDAIMDITNRGDIVLDPFLGSGATLLAAHKTGRLGRGIEIDVYYVDVSVERLMEATGEEAFDADGVSFTARRNALAQGE